MLRINMVKEEMTQAENYMLEGDCTMYETEAQYQAYIDGLEAALNIMEKTPNIKKAETLTEIRKTLDMWEDYIEQLGNECAYSDSMLDKLPKLVEDLMKI